jgi:hypothetical protein
VKISGLRVSLSRRILFHSLVVFCKISAQRTILFIRLRISPPSVFAKPRFFDLLITKTFFLIQGFGFSKTFNSNFSSPPFPLHVERNPELDLYLDPSRFQPKWHNVSSSKCFLRTPFHYSSSFCSSAILFPFTTTVINHGQLPAPAPT